MRICSNFIILFQLRQLIKLNSTIAFQGRNLQHLQMQVQYREGGAIGNELTCVLGKTKMILFIRKLKTRAESLALNIVLIWVYVDDTLGGCKKVRKGTRLSDDESC